MARSVSRNDKPFEFVGGPHDGKIERERIAFMPEEIRLPIGDKGLAEPTLARYVATGKRNVYGRWVFEFKGLQGRTA